MTTPTISKSLLFLIGLPFFSLLIFLTGCDISTGDDVSRNVGIRLSGSYTNPEGIPERQSGKQITRFTLSQSGDKLFVIDNEGTRWNGRIGSVEDSSATVTLRGLTTDRNEVVITGVIRVEGTTATFTGTWVEPGFSSPVFAEASVSRQPQPTPTPENGGGNGPTPTPTPNPTPVITLPPSP